ncbi:MAG: 1-acyl-sn-glycerol-3-phosphate acyltransferase, partial [Bacteroidota bacterium]
MDKILKDPQFQQILAQLAEQQKESVESLTREAAVYLREMRSKQSPMANAIWIEFIRRVSLRGYDQFIDVNPAEIRKLTRLSRRHPIAYTLTHKTYIDTLVLSLVLSRHGMPLPYTFAGANLDLPVFGDLSRQIGSIFIRRSFKDNFVYKWTLRYFIASLLNEKAHFMWAIEGTRSRTGKLVWPKMGILKYILESEQDSNLEVKYIPTSIVYDLIPDVKKMTEEGLGKGKNPENIMWLFNYLRQIGGKFGRISIRFDDPVDLVAKHSSIIPDQETSPFETGKPSVSKFAFELVHHINQITPVTTVSLICISLLSKYALTKKAIELDVMDMMQFIESKKSDALVDRGTPIAEGVQYALNLMSQADMIKQQGEGVNVKYFINTDQYLSATYYANMAVHHLYHRAFIELALVKIQSGKHEDRYLTFW